MPILRYTVLRLALLAGAFALLYLLGLRGWLLAVVAVVVAALLSFLLLSHQAQEAAGVIAQRAERRRGPSSMDRAIEEDAAAEDALLDGEDGTAPPSRGPQPPRED